jgi:uncharacterized membrane protein YdbT with pleckstrin-like domain
MGTRSFKPEFRYLVKVWLGIFVAGLLTIAGTVAFAFIIPDEDATVIFGLFALAEFVVWIVALALAAPYYRSLSYEIQDDEVIVHVGVVTQSVKHVPYRTVTNVSVRRDILDRWFFGLGSLHVQTAGMSGQSGAEEKLVGLSNVQEVYDLVVAQLRRFRGGMAPTAAEVEPEPETASTQTLAAILSELKAIRRAIEKER